MSAPSADAPSASVSAAEHPARRPSPRTRSGRARISRVPYLPGLDGMRAIAVVAVMIYHANSDWLKGGFLGVDVFFVISGYLITLLLIAEQERDATVSIRAFWVRRFRRLLPALFVMLTLLTIWTALFERDALGKLRGDVIGGLAYVSNWYQIWIGAGYSANNDWAPLRHLWSLAVEEQFYVVWPVVMVLLLRAGTRRIADLARYLVVGAVFVTVVVALLYHAGPIEPVVETAAGATTATPEAYWTILGRQISKADALYLSTFSRASALLLGAAFAMVWRPLAVMRGPLRDKSRLLDLSAVVGFLVLGVMAWRVGFINDDNGVRTADAWLFRGGFFLASVASLMMIAAVTHPRSLTSRALSTSVLLWIGTRSYGLYLYHWPIFQIVRNTAGTKLEFHEFVLCIVAAGIVTELSYRYIETPIRRGGLRALIPDRRRRSHPTDPRRRNIGYLAVVGVVGLVVFSLASLATADLKQNAVAESLDDNRESTCNILIEDCFGDTTNTSVDEPGPVASVAEGSSDTAVEPQATSPTTPPTTVPPPTTQPLLEAPELFALGDSVMLGAANQLDEAGFFVDAQESRQFSDGVKTVEALRERDLLPERMLLHLGTNGPVDAADVDAMVAALEGVGEVWIVTNAVEGDYGDANNSLFIQAAAANDNIQVLYWDGLAFDCPGDCFYEDGIHLRPVGQTYYVDLVRWIFEL